MKLEEGMYVRTEKGIAKILGRVNEPDNYYFKMLITDKYLKIHDDTEYIHDLDIIKSSKNIIVLIEYMDLLIVEEPIKLYDKNETIRLFNPVRCDGFTEFEDGTHCIILNLDYIVNVNDLKIKGVLTHEQFENNYYRIEE